MSAHRYWRIKATTTNGTEPNIVAVAEVEMYTSATGADVCTGGTALSDSNGYGTAASGAFNNTYGDTSLWICNNTGTAAYIGYDFGSGNDKDIVQVGIWPRPSTWYYQAPQGFDIQYSDDGSSWTTSYSITGVSWDKGVKWFNSGGETYPWTGTGNQRFWRLRSTTTQGGGTFSVVELEMYAGSGCKGSNLCTGGSPYMKNMIEGELAKAFDGTRTEGSQNYFASAEQASWVGYLLPSAASVTSIAIAARNTFYAQSPKDFVVEYWNGSSFTTAMTLSSITGWTANALRWFDSTGEISEPSACAPPSSARPMVFVCT
jgi:hypothetical protein